MRPISRNAVVALSAAIAFACRPSSFTETQKAAVADSAKVVAKGIFDNANKLDFPAAFKAYSADPDARYAENGVLYTSLDSMRKAYADFAPTLESVENTVDSWDVLVLGEDAAAMTLPVHLRIKAKGRPEYKGQYVWSGLVQKRGGSWKLIQSHESWLDADKVMAALAPAAQTKPK
jgi:ketosteroid isomerase-like protein